MASEPRYSDKALPCPFCGCAPLIQPWHGGPKSKRLIGCSVEGDCLVKPSVTGATEQQALDVWNTRDGITTRVLCRSSRLPDPDKLPRSKRKKAAHA